VIVEDQAILVLGGLIQEDLRQKEQRVPFLGSIPVIGALFRSTSTQKVKTNLMFFIKPTILRDNVQASFETNAKYNYIRDIQLSDEPTQKILPFIQAPAGAIPALETDDEPSIDLRTLTPDDSEKEVQDNPTGD
jgi:general secretion pathway protein D